MLLYFIPSPDALQQQQQKKIFHFDKLTNETLTLTNCDIRIKYKTGS